MLAKIKHKSKQHEESSFFNDVSASIMKLRSRILKIIDEQFWYWMEKLKTQKQQNDLIINEPILEDWVEMFKNQILVLKPKKTQQNTANVQNNQSFKRQNLKKLSFPKPLFMNDQKAEKEIIWSNIQNTINLFEYKPVSQNPYQQKWKLTSYQIPEGKLKPFCTITYSFYSNSLIVIGGHKESNPNIKSSKISRLNLTSSTFITVSNLPYGLSSHAVVSRGSIFYIIGGNRNHSIVTRGCFRFDQEQNVLQEITCLNYPVSNANCMIWKENWIYKFGGIGQAFGTWDNSPYIERYSIQQNCWEVINPIMQKQPQISFQMFLANSNSYICEQQNKIFVFGGYSIQGKYIKNAFILRINENNHQQQSGHVIEQYGTIQCNQLMSNRFVFTKNSLNILQMYGLTKQKDKSQINYPILINSFE